MLIINNIKYETIIGKYMVEQTTYSASFYYLIYIIYLLFFTILSKQTNSYDACNL